jgi:hypothetical protein
MTNYPELVLFLLQRGIFGEEGTPKGSHHKAQDVKDGPHQQQVPRAVTVVYFAPNRALSEC